MLLTRLNCAARCCLAMVSRLHSSEHAVQKRGLTDQAVRMGQKKTSVFQTASLLFPVMQQFRLGGFTIDAPCS